MLASKRRDGDVQGVEKQLKVSKCVWRSGVVIYQGLKNSYWEDFLRNPHITNGNFSICYYCPVSKSAKFGNRPLQDTSISNSMKKANYAIDAQFF